MERKIYKELLNWRSSKERQLSWCEMGNQTEPPKHWLQRQILHVPVLLLFLVETMDGKPTVKKWDDGQNVGMRFKNVW